MENLDFAT